MHDILDWTIPLFEQLCSMDKITKIAMPAEESSWIAVGMRKVVLVDGFLGC